MSDHNTRNPLSDLVGQTIDSITMQELDMYGNGANVRQFYTIRCANGTVLVLGVDGNVTQQYATAELMEESEFAELVCAVNGVADECCQRCTELFHPDDVLILDDQGSVCKGCCTVEDVKLAIQQGTVDTDNSTAAEFLEDWQSS